MRGLGGPWEPTVGELAASIFCREFVPVYEPVVHLTTGAVLGWEVRGRWIHPTRGMVTTADYAGRAEHAGLLDPIDEIVIDRALRRFRRWSAGHFNPSDPWLAITIPGGRLACGAVLEWLRPLVGQYSIPLSHVVLEISEFASIMRRPGVVETLSRWRDLGGVVAVESGALGRRSLDLLISPIDVVKLEPGRVADVTDEGPGEAYVATVIERATQAGARVVAEGVVTSEQRRVLTTLGCDAAQGPLIGHPDAELVQPAVSVYVR